MLRQRYRLEYLAAWEYNTNVTDTNSINLITVSAENAKKNKKLSQAIRDLRYNHLDDPCIQRQAKLLADAGTDILNEEDFKTLKNAINKMQTNYASTKVCSYKNPLDCSLSLEPHIQERLSNSRDPKELAHYWQEWHNKVGTPMKDNFAKYVELSGKAANLNSK